LSISIPLSSRDGTIAVAVIDDIDAHLARFTWSRSDGYAMRRKPLPDGTYQHVKLHREVMGVEPGDPRLVDHRNRDRLDCRRSNLELSDPGANSRNRGLRADNSTGLKGVSSCSRRPGWFHAQIGYSRDGVSRKESLGDWETRELAGYAYDLRAQEVDDANVGNQALGLLPPITREIRQEIMDRRPTRRSARRQQSSRPVILRQHPRSGLFGIAWIEQRQRWRVHFSYAGRRYSGGYWDDRIAAGYRVDELLRSIDPDAMTNEGMGWLPHHAPDPAGPESPGAEEA
jgi:hypothetical protein